jgi:hypothetical protein
VSYPFLNLLFKFFVNDIFLFVNKCDLYNYADNNTLSKSDNTLETVIESLEEDSRSLMSWFAFNKMQEFRAESLTP